MAWEPREGVDRMSGREEQNTKPEDTGTLALDISAVEAQSRWSSKPLEPPSWIGTGLAWGAPNIA